LISIAKVKFDGAHPAPCEILLDHIQISETIQRNIGERPDGNRIENEDKLARRGISLATHFTDASIQRRRMRAKRP
jgi:hypothetical protein